MPLMRWDESLDVGVEAMNDEHKHIVDLMNRIRDESEAGLAGGRMIELTEDLERATLEHFIDEEAYMASIDYDGLSSHRLAHEELSRKLSYFCDETEENNGRISHAFLMFMMLWLQGHMKGVDMKYSGAPGAVSAPVRKAG